ncbi:MAG: hypothetical protein AB7N76_14640 [Planctomycetota bacterium]
MPGDLTVLDRSFPLASCELFAHLDDHGLRWGVECRCAEAEFLDECVRPRADCDAVFHSSRGSAPWRSLFPRAALVPDPPDRDLDPSGVLKVFDHCAIRHSRLELSTFGDGVSCELVWTGRCDVLASELYDRDLPFRLVGTATFVGLLNGKDSRAVGVERYGPYLDLSGFDFEVQGNGVTRFAPR